MPTREFLLQACDIVDNKIELFGRRYQQDKWLCDTACCLHGYALLLESGGQVEVSRGLGDEDYSDLSTVVRCGVRAVLSSSNGTPLLIRQVLSGDIKLGPSVGIGRNMVIGSGSVLEQYVRIGVDVVIGKDVLVGQESYISSGVHIPDNSYIPPGSVVNLSNECDFVLSAGSILRIKQRQE